jgi:hypothetical protein
MGVFFSSNLMKRVQAYANIDPPMLSIQIRHGRTSCTTSIRTILPSTPLDLHFLRLEIRHYDSQALTVDSMLVETEASLFKGLSPFSDYGSPFRY